MRSRQILITAFFLFLSIQVFGGHQEVPEEARVAAELRLKGFAVPPELGEPYPKYGMISKDLLKITVDESSLLANADFVCFEFPYIIGGKPRGMIGIRNTGEEWRYYYMSGVEPLYNVTYNLRMKRPESEIAFLAIDSHLFFAVVELKEKTVLIPQNTHTHNLFKGTIYEGEQFPWISYSIARSVLQKYASGDTDKGCIKHEE